VGVKIGIVGAGSAVFSLSLIKDLCRTPNLKDSVVSLMDVDAERLDNAYLLCTRYAAETGSRLRIEKTMDRRACLQGADFVINTALVVGYPQWREGWAIASRLGYRFGGSLHVMHDEAFWINFYQFELMESVLRDVLEICPNAWYLLVANPVLAGVTWLSRKYAGAKFVGLCHGYGGVYRLADALGLEHDKISYEIPGVNHFVWMNRFEYEGKDAFPLLDTWIREKSAQHFRTCEYSDYVGPKIIDLYRRFGVMPIGDTGNPGGGTWGYWYHTDRRTERKWKEDPVRWFNGYFTSGLQTVADIKRVANDQTVRVSDAFPGTSGEPMIPLIEALACNVERTAIVNIPNTGGFVEGVPLDFQVEVPATVNGRGVAGKKTRKLPDPVLRFLHRDRIAPVEIEIEAFRTGKRELMIELLLMDPWTKSGDQAERLFAEILRLPFNEGMRRYFGSPAGS
jgi:alpha-galactosidase